MAYNFFPKSRLHAMVLIFGAEGGGVTSRGHHEFISLRDGSKFIGYPGRAGPSTGGRRVFFFEKNRGAKTFFN